MSEYVYAGLTSQTVDVFVRDSASTTGQGLTGLVYNTSNLVASYRKGATGSRTAITLATQTVGGAFSSGGFVEIDATNMPGCYRLDLPNAAVDSLGFVTVFLKGATNMVPVALRIDCRPIPADVRQFGGTNGTFSSGVPTVELDSDVETQIDNIENAAGYLLAVAAGACADPQTAAETYAITVFGSTFTVDMAGQDSTGTRTAPTLTKS